MPIYDAKSIPVEVHSSTKDHEVAAFLKTGPVLGAHKPIHEQRVEHNAFIDTVKPPIGRIEHLVLDGPHEVFRCACTIHLSRIRRMAAL